MNTTMTAAYAAVAASTSLPLASVENITIMMANMLVETDAVTRFPVSVGVRLIIITGAIKDVPPKIAIHNRDLTLSRIFCLDSLPLSSSRNPRGPIEYRGIVAS